MKDVQMENELELNVTRVAVYNQITNSDIIIAISQQRPDLKIDEAYVMLCHSVARNRPDMIAFNMLRLGACVMQLTTVEIKSALHKVDIPEVTMIYED